MIPDALSCQIDHQMGKGDNQDQIMLSTIISAQCLSYWLKHQTKGENPANPLQQMEIAPPALLSKEKGQVF